MSTVPEMLERFEAFLANVDSYGMEIITAMDDAIIEAVQDQLWHGKDGNGHDLRPYAWDEYAEFKLTLNPLGVTDLKFHGFFYDAMRVQILSKNSFSVVSDDRKFESLMEKYGYDTMVVGEEKIMLLRQTEFLPKLMQLISDLTGVGLASA